MSVGMRVVLPVLLSSGVLVSGAVSPPWRAVRSSRVPGPATVSVRAPGIPVVRAGQAGGLVFVTDEADAALAIVRARHDGRDPTTGDWARLFGSLGFRALQQRQAVMGRAFADSSFRAFLLSDTLVARWAALDRTLAAWRALDVSAAARRALAYLPAGTPLQTTVFLAIKPQTNSFVFDFAGRRVIMLYVDPAKSRAEPDNTVAHELHHIGLSAACGAAGASGVPAPVARARNWASALGEGLAMLAAAGGPDVHPHAQSDSATRARWDRDVSHFNADVSELTKFCCRALDPTVPDDSVTAAGMSFFGVQGPWYTVGWKMAVTVERAYGRPRLIATECDAAAFLRAYNAAARARNWVNGDSLAVWPEMLTGRMEGRARGDERP